MSQMMRKQIYIQKRQQILLRRLAKARGVSEAEIIRQAIDEHTGSTTLRIAPSDPTAWQKAYQFMLDLQAQGPVPGQRRQWKREDAYEERLSRYDRRTD